MLVSKPVYKRKKYNSYKQFHLHDDFQPRSFAKWTSQINSVGMTLASENSPRPSQPLHVHWKPVGKHMVRAPNGPGLGIKNMSETVGRILISRSFRKQNHSTWLALLVPTVEPRTGWQITQTVNEVELFNERLSPPEFVPFCSAECPLIAAWIMYSGDSKPVSYICMKSIKQQCIVEWRF